MRVRSRRPPECRYLRGVVSIERPTEVVDAASYEATWIPIGRDIKQEQVLLEKIARIDTTTERKPLFMFRAP